MARYMLPTQTSDVTGLMECICIMPFPSSNSSTSLSGIWTLEGKGVRECWRERKKEGEIYVLGVLGCYYGFRVLLWC